MKKFSNLNTFGLLALLLVLSMSGCKKYIICEKGAGAVVTETIQLSDVDGVDLCIAADVNLTYGETQEVRVTAQPNVIDNLSRDVRNGVWSVQFDECVRRYDGITIDITTPHLEVISVSGSGDVRSTNHFPEQNDLDIDISGSGSVDVSIDADEITSRISGSGDMDFEGSSRRIEHRVSGSGSLSAFSMETEEVTIRIAGSGTARTTATSRLDVNISGSGDVYYRGTPEIDVNISGSGELINNN